MVTRRNLTEIVKRLLELLESAEGHFRDELIAKVLFMCARDKYAYLADFAWYVSVLAKLAYIPDTKHSGAVAGQLLDVSVRVEDVRPFALQSLLPMLADPTLASAARKDAAAAAAAPVADAATVAADAAAAAAAVDTSGGVASATAALSGTAGSGSVLYAAAWITGEFAAAIPPQVHSAVLDALLQPGALTLPAAVQGVYVQSALKLLAVAATAAAKAGPSALPTYLALASSVLERLIPFSASVHVEVQERACLVQQLLAALGVPFTPPTPAGAAAVAAAAADADDLMALAAGTAATTPSKAATATPVALAQLPPLDADLKLISAVLSALFAEPLKPVNAKAQRKVAVPAGLDLDKWIREEEGEWMGGAAAACRCSET